MRQTDRQTELSVWLNASCDAKERSILSANFGENKHGRVWSAEWSYLTSSVQRVTFCLVSIEMVGCFKVAKTW
jgi:hypothetical protein